MKERVGRLATETIARVRTWFDPPLGADARPLEVREAIIEDVVRRVEPAGGGRRVLPLGRVSVTVLADSLERRAALGAALADLPAAIERRLKELKCDVPGGFGVHVEYTKRPRPGWTSEQRLAVECKRASPSDHPPSTQEHAPLLQVAVVRGASTKPSYTFSERQIRIGRTENPVDEGGRPRHNHVVFLEGTDEDSRTVGRSHASIRYLVDRREYRLFDDGSHNGTRIVRNGSVLDVTPRDPVGVTIVSGDEIMLGAAAVRVRVTDAEPAPLPTNHGDGETE